MKPLYIIILTALFLLFTISLNAQIAFVEDTTVPFEGVYESDAVFADIDGDGDQDVLISGRNSSNVKITNLYTNDGFGGYALVLGTPFIGFENGDAAFADIDGDNDLDLIIAGEVTLMSGSTKLYTNNGSGIFTEELGATFDASYWGSTDFADVDDDDDLDLLLTGRRSNTELIAKLYINDGNGVFTESIGTPFIGVEASDSAFADIDGDNDLDILITGSGGNSNPIISRLYENDGSGNFILVTGI